MIQASKFKSFKPQTKDLKNRPHGMRRGAKRPGGLDSKMIYFVTSHNFNELVLDQGNEEARMRENESIFLPLYQVF